MTKGRIKMSILLDLLNLAAYLPFLKTSEEDISRNINTLKRYEWFKKYYQSEQYTELIIHDPKVRTKIGSFNTKRLTNLKYQAFYQNKINKILRRQLKAI